METKNDLIARMERTQQKAAEAAKRQFVKNQRDRQQRAADKAKRIDEELRDAGFGSDTASIGA